MEENKRISDLFEQARTEAPKTSFDEVTKHVLAASAVGGVGVLAKWAALSFKLKVIIMTSALITLTVSGLLISSALNSNPTKTEQKKMIVPWDNFEIIQEDGIRETIIYDDQDQVLEVIVDSSSKLIDEAEETIPNTVLELNPHQLATSEHEINAAPPATTEIDNTTSEGEEKGKERRFEITEKTTKEELEEIQNLAEKAGIKMQYNARIKGNIIKRLSMNWSLSNEDNSSNWNIAISGSDDFRVEVGWEEDKNGKAIGFLNDNSTKSGSTHVNVSSGSNGSKVEIRN